MNTVYLLTAEIENDIDFDGVTTIHATPDGALARFEQWRTDAEIPTEIAYGNAAWTDTFLGADYEHGNTVLHWGINRMEVHDTEAKVHAGAEALWTAMPYLADDHSYEWFHKAAAIILEASPGTPT